MQNRYTRRRLRAGALGLVKVAPTARAPLTVPGLLQWFRADAIPPQADGSTVAGWADQSTHGRDAYQPDDSHRPTYQAAVLNGLPVLRFSGSQSFFHDYSLAGPSSIVAVCNRQHTDDSEQSVYAATAPGSVLVNALSAKTATANEWGSYLNGWRASSFDLTGTFRTVASLSDGISTGTATNRLITGPDTETVTDDSGRFAGDTNDRRGIGGNPVATNAYLVGDVAEILVYDHEVTDDELATLLGYLTAKYGL
jgi:hypothetical protein